MYHPRVCHVPPTCCTSLCRAGPVPLSVRPVLCRRPQLHAAALPPHHAAGCPGVSTAARLRRDVQRVRDSAAHILCPCCGGSTGSVAPCIDQSGIPVTLGLFVKCRPLPCCWRMHSIAVLLVPSYAGASMSQSEMHGVVQCTFPLQRVLACLAFPTKCPPPEPFFATARQRFPPPPVCLAFPITFL